MNLYDKVTVITGAASGFGREFAVVAAKLGMKLVLADVQEDALEKVRHELEEQGHAVLTVVCDVSKSDQVQALADAAMEKFGAVHLLFNNAGVACGGLVWENTQADWDWVLGVNLWGVINGVRIFTPLMLSCAEREPGYQGHIVNTASMAGLLNVPAMGVYNVSKSAVVALTETLYHDLKLVDAPIGASVICPYFVPTGIAQSHRNRPGEMQNEGEPTVSQRASLALTQKAVNSGKVSAAELAQTTFDAVRDGQFYIYSHPEALGNVQSRMEDIVARRNPSDPYAATPKVREHLRNAIATGAKNREKA